MNLPQLVTKFRELDHSLKSHVTRAANVGLTMRNWLVGAYIVEFEHNGQERADYGAKLTHTLAKEIKNRGLNARTIADCRLLHLPYSTILQTLSAKLKTLTGQISQTLSAESRSELSSGGLEKGQTLSGFSARPDFVVPINVSF